MTITIEIVDVKGSAPRGVGTCMHIGPDGQTGTIGGGTLEWEATQLAQRMLDQDESFLERRFSLGPELGQCCGGAVTLRFSKRDIDAARTPVWIWGAGHVGRALAQVLAPSETYDVTLIDTASSRMPAILPSGVNPLVAAAPTQAARHAPADALHVIVTYSHDLDLELCNELLKQDTSQIGLIGSATKWARFQKRLTSLGRTPEQVLRIQCPIGDVSLGKAPQAIAVGVASALLSGGRLSKPGGDSAT